MAGSVPEIQIQVNSKKGGNSIHPVEPARTSAGGGPPVVYREIKHFKKWFPWLIPSFVIANVVTFLVTMYVNNCPHNSVSCVAGFLGRFSFQPFSENPLLGPSSNTYVYPVLIPFFLFKLIINGVFVYEISLFYGVLYAPVLKRALVYW